MSDSEIIDYYYGEAVKGITAEMLSIKNIYAWYNHIIDLPEKEKTVYLIVILDDQVSNGGFNQYFFNGYGQFAPETVEALKSINANQTAKLVELAYEAVNTEEYAPLTFREKIMLRQIDLIENDALDDYLDKLDDQYYEYPDDLGKLLGIYLRS